MSTRSILASVRTPELEFNFETGEFSRSGGSYPEDVRTFYDEPVARFVSWLETSDSAATSAPRASSWSKSAKSSVAVLVATPACRQAVTVAGGSRR